MAGTDWAHCVALGDSSSPGKNCSPRTAAPSPPPLSSPAIRLSSSLIVNTDEGRGDKLERHGQDSRESIQSTPAVLQSAVMAAPCVQGIRIWSPIQLQAEEAEE